MDEKKTARKNPYFGTEPRAPITPRHKDSAPEPVAQPDPKPVEKEEAVVEKPESTTNLLAELKNKKPIGKSCNVYLDADVIEELDKLAKQTKTNRSKVMNTLLRNLLIEQ